MKMRIKSASVFRAGVGALGALLLLLTGCGTPRPSAPRVAGAGQTDAVGAAAAAVEIDSGVLPNGAFECVDPADARRPAGWELPDGEGVRWAAAPGRGHGRAICLDTRRTEQQMMESWRRCGLDGTWNIPKPAANAIADTYGLSYYSAAIPVVSGRTYRVQCVFYGQGGAKLWVRGTGLFRGRQTRCYEAVLKCEGAPGVWTTNSLVFHPTRQRQEVDAMRVMLYAYYPAREYWFDDVRIEAVEETAAGRMPIPTDPSERP